MKLATRIQPLLERMGFQFREAPRTSLFSEVAVDQFLKLITQVGDPDEILRQAGITRQKLRVCTSDDEISGAMDTRRDAVIATPWQLHPVDGGGKTLERNELPEPVQWLWTEFERVAETVIGACMEALPYGYSVQEAVYMRADNGRLTWGEITEKPFEWFVPKLDGSVLYKSMTNPMGEETDARKFFLTARRQTYRNPYGDALFSRLYWVWFFRTNGWKFWVKWLERFGTPLLVGTTPGNASDMARALALAVQDAAVAVGAGSTVQTIEQGSGSGHFEGFERACCGRIQKLILGQTLTTDSGGSSGKSGSYALGKVHEQVREDKRDSDIRMVTKSIQRMMNVMWALNGFPGSPPTFIMQDQTGLEMERAERDAKLVQSGAVKLKAEYFSRVYDYEAGDIDEEAMNAPPPAPFGGPQQPPVKGKIPVKASAGLDRFTPEQQVIERGVVSVKDQLESVIANAEIQAVVRAATSPHDLQDRLLVLLADRGAEEFQQTFERALFAADIIGYAHAGGSE